MRSSPDILGGDESVFEPVDKTADPLAPFVQNAMEISEDKTIPISQKLEQFNRLIAAVFMQGKLSNEKKV